MADRINVVDQSGTIGSLSPEEFKEASQYGVRQASPQEVSDYFAKEDYGGGVLNPLIAGTEEALGTATLGLSRQAENATGITTPEAQEARAKFNPIANKVGFAAGIAGPLLIPGGGEAVAAKELGETAEAIHAAKDAYQASDLLNPIKAIAKTGSKVTKALTPEIPEGASLAAKILKTAPAAVVGSAVEGAAFGLGNAVTEDALGDPNALSEKLLANVGYGALIGGALGAGFKGAELGGGKLAQVFKAGGWKNKIAEGADEALTNQVPEAAAQSMAADSTPAAVRSLDEIRARVKNAGPIMPEGLPSSYALKDAVNQLPDLEFKPHNLQYESLTDQGLRDYYKTFLESQEGEAKVLRDYEALQKQEGVAKTKFTIDQLAPSGAAVADEVQAGNNLIKKITDQYKDEKAQLAPLFRQFDELASQKQMSTLDSVTRLNEIFPTIGDYLNADADGKFILSKYSPDMPFSKNTYGAIKDLVDSSNKKNMTLSGLRNIREAMRDRITIAAGPRDQSQIGSIRKMLMDVMEDKVEQLSPDLELRDTFKRYAQNEERRTALEKLFGGSIDENASFTKAIKPEDVVNRLFSNSQTVKAARELLGKDFDQAAADYLASHVERMTDRARNGFSSQKFATFLKDKTPELNEALAGKPGTLQRFKALADYMRILPDAPSVNPSGTAKATSILQRMAGISKILDPKNAILDFAKKFEEKAQAQKQRMTIDEVLAGKTFPQAEAAAQKQAENYSVLHKLESMGKDVSKKVIDLSKSIFKVGAKSAELTKEAVGVKASESPVSPKKSAKNDSDKDLIAKIKSLQNNPDHFVDALLEKTAGVSPTAPKIAQALQASAARATSYLASVAPDKGVTMPLSKESEFPKSELQTFKRHLQVVEDPTIVLGQIKNATITKESVQALQTVYPQLYREMAMSVGEELAKYLDKNGPEKLPYKTKMSLSLFFGSDLDNSLTQPSIMANQISLMSNGAAQAANAAKGAVRTSQTGLSKLNQASAMLTPMQASAQRSNV